MSRIGKKPIDIPAGVTAAISGQEISIKGPKGELKQRIHPQVKVEEKEKQLIVTVADENDKSQRALWGLFGSLLKNMIKGVTEGYIKKLEVNGVGYKVNLQGKTLVLNVGFSHPVEYKLPEGINGEVEKNLITLSGIDNQLIGEVAAQIRKIRKPEPYKGKGIKYLEEVIKKKVGKTSAKG